MEAAAVVEAVAVVVAVAVGVAVVVPVSRWCVETTPVLYFRIRVY